MVSQLQYIRKIYFFFPQIRPLYTSLGVSSILVIGGSGAFFDAADTVLMMDCYVPTDVTAQAKAIAGRDCGGGQASGDDVFPRVSVRSPIRRSVERCLQGSFLYFTQAELYKKINLWYGKLKTFIFLFSSPFEFKFG